jgi:hypothetical protein
MSVHRKSSRPTGITNEAGEPEIVLEIEGLTLSMTPPGRAATDPPNDADEAKPDTDDDQRD